MLKMNKTMRVGCKITGFSLFAKIFLRKIQKTDKKEDKRNDGIAGILRLLDFYSYLVIGLQGNCKKVGARRDRRSASYAVKIL